MPAQAIGRHTRVWYEVDNWIFAQGQSIRTGPWSEQGPMPAWMADTPGVREELASWGILGWDGRWAPVNDGSFLWAAVSGLDGLTRRTVWMIKIIKGASTSTGPTQSQSTAKSSGLPDGAPPANQPGDPLARLRFLVRRKGFR